MRLSVLVPTYRRPRDLDRCLAAIASQLRAADEVVVVVRVGDDESSSVVQSWEPKLPINFKRTDSSGVVNALNAGLGVIRESDVVCITDDDAAPRPDWLSRIEGHFRARPDIGGVGGRDWVHNADVEKDQRLVGRVLWYGRIIGNHHLGTGEAREVDVLKGVNMSFRMEALTGIRFDVKLRGAGAQVSNEMALSFEVQRGGWLLLYDPLVAVDHFQSVRHDYDQRAVFEPTACSDAAFNAYWAIGHCMQAGPRRALALHWQSLVGTWGEPGVLRVPLARLRGDTLAFQRWKFASSGRRVARSELNCIRQVRAETA